MTGGTVARSSPSPDGKSLTSAVSPRCNFSCLLLITAVVAVVILLRRPDDNSGQRQRVLLFDPCSNSRA